MGSVKVLALTAALLIFKACSVRGQARVEYVNQPYCSATISSAPAGSVDAVWTAAVQTAPQLVVPAIIKPIVQPCETYGQDLAPTVPNFNNFNGYGQGFFPSMPPPMPPIILEDGDDDNWHHILYFLLFALRNRRGCGGYGYGGGCGGGCGGGYGGYGGGYGGGCGGGCGGNCGGNCGGYGGGYGGGCSCGGGCGGSCGGYNGGYGGGCGCGGGCNYNNNNGCFSYLPYPIPFPSSCGFQGYGVDGNSGVVHPEDSGFQNQQPQQPNEINLIIKTDT